MHPVIDKLQKAAECGPNDSRLSPSRPVFEGRDDGQNGNGARNDEEDFRIMQHFVRDLIEGS